MLKSSLAFRIQRGLTKTTLALRYLTGTLRPFDAQRIFTEVQVYAGWHSVATLSERDVHEAALETYEDTLELADVVASTCQRVSLKYDYSPVADAMITDALNDLSDEAERLGLALVARNEPEPMKASCEWTPPANVTPLPACSRYRCAGHGLSHEPQTLPE